MAKKYRYTIYLAREEVTSYPEALTEAGLASARSPNATVNPMRIDDEHNFLLIIFHGFSQSPKWEKHIQKLDHVFPSAAKGKYPSGLVFLTSNERIFIVSFGGGHHFVDKNKIVDDFGLRTVINCITDEKIRALEKTNLGELLRGMSQSAFEAGLQTFDVRSSLDIIQSISGSIKDDVGIGDRASGSTSLKITTQTEITSIQDTCSDALTFYESEAYKGTRFAIIDNLFPIKEEDLVQQVSAAMIADIRQNEGGFELAIPELFSMSADISYARVTGAGNTAEYPDINLEQYREILGEHLDALTIADLGKHKLEVFYGDGQLAHSSSIFKCLIGSTEHNGEKYALNEGQWYRVNSDFKEVVEQLYVDHLDANLDNLFPPVEIVEKEPHKKADRKKGVKVKGYEDEIDYNTRVSQQHGLILLDRDTVRIPELPNDKVEVCDLLDVENKRLIHVKKSSRSSSVLSHFFKQGSNSTQLIYNSNSFRGAAEQKVANLLGADFEFGDLREYTVLFVIADKERSKGGHNIPFFSKISFKDDCERIAPVVDAVRICYVTQPDADADADVADG